MDIKGATALITGGASGLGAACSRMIAGAGGRVVLIDLKDDLGAAMEKELGGSAAYLKADVTDEAGVQRAIQTAKDKFGGLQIAINCAGIGESRRVVGKEGPVALDWFTRIINVNLVGTFNVARLSAAAMAQNAPNAEGERGVIVNTASIAAYEGQIGQVAYAASKGGIVGLTLPLARDLSRQGVRVVTIAPGVFDTPLLGRHTDEVKGTLASAVPFPQRLGRPPEFAALARHIIENVMLNGEVIRLDGALRMSPK